MTIETDVKNVADDVIEKLKNFPWENKAMYAEWLAQTYFYVSHSTRLLALAASRMPFDSKGNIAHVRFGKHIGEERSHEKLALHDLRNLGYDIEHMAELNSTRMFYETQYFKIEHLSPYALMGYILMLEATAPAATFVEEHVNARHGAHAATFIKLHVNEDVEHVQKAIELVQKLGIIEQNFIKQNLQQSADAYKLILSSIAD